MKIAILGDIHGNIEALKAAHEAAQIDGDKIYHLGDLGGYAPFVNEVVDFLIEHGIEGVRKLRRDLPMTGSIADANMKTPSRLKWRLSVLNGQRTTRLQGAGNI
jgi:hypothetical protein